ncbi:MAG: hypothetical protein GWP48_08855 [Actinobacteria bacterium]|nr:hypothetical protein [Actinomycetota bacterium]
MRGTGSNDVVVDGVFVPEAQTIAAVDHYREYIKNRVLPYSPGDRQVEQQASQIRLAEALATVHAARLAWEDAIEQVTATYRSGGIHQPQRKRAPSPRHRLHREAGTARRQHHRRRGGRVGALHRFRHRPNPSRPGHLEGPCGL